MTRRIPVLALLLLATACSSSTTPRVRQYAGLYQSGFEVEAFRPCDAREAWWVTEGATLRSRYAAVATAPYQSVYVVVRGELSPPGRYGHLGEYPRELAVRELLELRPARDGDCS